MNILRRVSITKKKDEAAKPVDEPAAALTDEPQRRRSSFLGLGGGGSKKAEDRRKSGEDNPALPPRGGGGSMRKSQEDSAQPHPYENVEDLPVRTSARKSVVWKNPDTPNVDDVLRARAKSFRAKEGGRQSVSWAASPLS